jgi:chromosomal replication initiation ATPase DnaA
MTDFAPLEPSAALRAAGRAIVVAADKLTELCGPAASVHVLRELADKIESGQHQKSAEVIYLPGRHRKTMPGIVRMVAEQTGYSYAELIGPSRKHGVAHARQYAMSLCRQETTRGGHPRWSYPAIGTFFGGRDHCTVWKGIRRHEQRIDKGASNETGPVLTQPERV